MTNNIEKPTSAVYIAKTSDFAIGCLVSLLSDEEKARFDRLRRPADKERHALAHSLKRVVLAQYVSSAPHALHFSRSSSGKPFCLYPGSPYFSLSHSGDWVVLAISTEGEIGVDIEFERKLDTDALTQRIGSAREIDVYQNSDTPQQCFLRLWTQKEAVSKACGQGISVGLSSIPCSGEVGVHALSFLGVSYTSHTYAFPDDGVLSYVGADLPALDVVRVSNITDGAFGKIVEGIIFEL
jgi:phosphopantetheinyl transferase